MIFNKNILALLITSLTTSVQAFDTIEVDGNAFWKGADRFYIRGVDYQPGGSSSTTTTDPLSDINICIRDVEKFVDLGINTVRVYSIDPTKDHSECMNLLKENNIYLLLDVNNPTISINRASPNCSYNSFYMKNVFDIIDEFSNYDNTLGFFAANEVINDEKTTNTAKYVKAVVRDMKQYITARQKRSIPVGYSAADILTNRKQQIEYFTCGNDTEARVDFWGHNDYSWCGESDLETSGYKQLLEDFAKLPIPIFFSEFGCNSKTDRPFTEIKEIYSTDMSSVLSGGLVYEYSQESNNYGLVKIDSASSVTELGSYTNLKKQYSENPIPSGIAGASPNNTWPECPSVSSTWLSDFSLPDQPSAISSMIINGAGAVVSIAELGQTSTKCYADYNYPTGPSNGTTLSNSTVYSNSTTYSNSTISANTTLDATFSSVILPTPSSTLSDDDFNSLSESSTSSTTTKKSKKEKHDEKSISSENGQARLSVPVVAGLIYGLINLL